MFQYRDSIRFAIPIAGESGTMSRISYTSRIASLRSYPVCAAFRFRMQSAITHVTHNLDIDRAIKLIPSLGARFVCKVSDCGCDPQLHFYHSLYSITALLD